MKTIWTSLIIAVAFNAAACSSIPSVPAMPTGVSSASTDAQDETTEKADASTAPGGLLMRGTVAAAAELLAAGKEAEARTILHGILAQTPRDTTAQMFLRQIESDPIVLLGEPATDPYVVQAGDTMSGLADRFLGDSRMFYALSRYNALGAPNALSVGRVLKLPASAIREANAASASQSAALKPVDPAKANAIRLQALQHLNTGDVRRAVDLLKQAVMLDPTDPAIRKDLERAERIQGALSKG